MTLKIEAIYENGVFVPAKPPALADHERVRLTVETASESAPPDTQIVRHRRENRIHVDPQLSQEIAKSAEFDPFEI